MRGYLVYVLIVKHSSHRFSLNSATVYWIGRPYRGIFFFFGGGERFLEGSVDHVIYLDHRPIVNLRFFIYCSLARGQWRTGKNGEKWLQNHLVPQQPSRLRD